ncbi:MAG: antiviral reverse transcriptase Drt2 [Bacteroidota bacterium]
MGKAETAELFKIWEEKESKTLLSRKRRYYHFDRRISFAKNRLALKSYLGNSENIQNHSFYPFIHATISTPRYKKHTTKDIDGKEKVERKFEIKSRNVAYAAHYDAYIYSWYSTVLTSKYEKIIEDYGIEDNVLAYLEKGMSNIDFAYDAFKYIKEKGNCAVLAFDVKGFFDSLDHEHLKKMWLKVLGGLEKLPKDHYNIFKSVTNYTYVEQAGLVSCFPNFYKALEENKKIKDKSKKKTFDRICSPKEFREIVRNKGFIKVNPFKNNIVGCDRFGKPCGIPQGSPISACLSNIYMIDFDVDLKKIIDYVGGKYYRYSDDILLIVDREHEVYVEEEFRKVALRNYLVMGEDKTEKRYFSIGKNDKLNVVNEKEKNKPLQYLGFEFDGNNIYIRSSSFSKYYRRMSARIRENLKAAYGKNTIAPIVFTKKIFNRYSDKGKRNFISYAKRAGETMDSDTIKKQSKNSINRVKKRLLKKINVLEEKKGNQTEP